EPPTSLSIQLAIHFEGGATPRHHEQSLPHRALHHRALAHARPTDDQQQVEATFDELFGVPTQVVIGPNHLGVLGHRSGHTSPFSRRTFGLRTIWFLASNRHPVVVSVMDSIVTN